MHTPFPFETLVPLFLPPGNDDWRRNNPDEEVIRSLRSYQRDSSINRPTRRRNKIQIQPIGDITSTHDQLFRATKEMLEAYFQVSVELLAPLPSSKIPKKHWRKSLLHGESWLQADGAYILDTVLDEQLSQTAVVLKALTTFDLWDGGTYNYVFGLGSLEDRVAVTSLWRLGDFHSVCDANELFSVLKTVVHEVGHAFSLDHCVEFSCCMNGSNDAEEGELQPLELCPSCLKKLAWNIGFDPLCHLIDVQRACSQWGFANTAERYEELITAATDISTYEGESEFIISAHGDTNFAHSQITPKGEWLYGTLDNFVGIKAVMDACFDGNLNGARVEITYGEETGMAGAIEVSHTVNPEDVVIVVDVTGYHTSKDLVIENCRSPWMFDFIQKAFERADFTYEIFSNSGDPVSQIDETVVYQQRTDRSILLAIPCDGGNYNTHVVRSRRRSLEAATSALKLLFAHFIKAGRPAIED